MLVEIVWPPTGGAGPSVRARAGWHAVCVALVARRWRAPDESRTPRQAARRARSGGVVQTPSTHGGRDCDVTAYVGEPVRQVHDGRSLPAGWFFENGTLSRACPASGPLPLRVLRGGAIDQRAETGPCARVCGVASARGHVRTPRRREYHPSRSGDVQGGAQLGLPEVRGRAAAPHSTCDGEVQDPHREGPQATGGRGSDDSRI